MKLISTLHILLLLLLVSIHNVPATAFHLPSATSFLLRRPSLRTSARAATQRTTSDESHQSTQSNLGLADKYERPKPAIDIRHFAGWSSDPPEVPVDAYKLLAYLDEERLPPLLEGVTGVKGLDVRVLNVAENQLRSALLDVTRRRQKQFSDEDSVQWFSSRHNVTSRVFGKVRRRLAQRHPHGHATSPLEDLAYPAMDSIEDSNREEAFSMYYEYFRQRCFSDGASSEDEAGEESNRNGDGGGDGDGPLGLPPASQLSVVWDPSPSYLHEWEVSRRLEYPTLRLHAGINASPLFGCTVLSAMLELFALVNSPSHAYHSTPIVTPPTDAESEGEDLSDLSVDFDFPPPPPFHESELDDTSRPRPNVHSVLYKQKELECYEFVEGPEGDDEGLDFNLFFGQTGDYGMSSEEEWRYVESTKDKSSFDLYNSLIESGVAPERAIEICTNSARRRESSALWQSGRLPVRELTGRMLGYGLEETAKLLTGGAQLLQRLGRRQLDFTENCLAYGCEQYMGVSQHEALRYADAAHSQQASLLYMQSLIIVHELLNRIRTARGFPLPTKYDVGVLEESGKRGYRPENKTEEDIVDFMLGFPSEGLDLTNRTQAAMFLYEFFNQACFDGTLLKVPIDIDDHMHSLGYTHYVLDRPRPPRIRLSGRLFADDKYIPLLAHTLLEQMLTVWELSTVHFLDPQMGIGQSAVSLFEPTRFGIKRQELREKAEINDWPFHFDWSADLTLLMNDTELAAYEREEDQDDEETADWYLSLIAKGFPADRALDIINEAVRRHDPREAWRFLPDAQEQEQEQEKDDEEDRPGAPRRYLKPFLGMTLPVRELAAALVAECPIEAERLMYTGLPSMLYLAEAFAVEQEGLAGRELSEGERYNASMKMIAFMENAFKQACVKAWYDLTIESAIDDKELKRQFLENTFMVEQVFDDLRNIMLTTAIAKGQQPPSHADTNAELADLGVAGYGDQDGAVDQRKRDAARKLPRKKDFGQLGAGNRDAVVRGMYGVLNEVLFDGALPWVPVEWRPDLKGLSDVRIQVGKTNISSIWLNPVVADYGLLAYLLIREMTHLWNYYRPYTVGTAMHALYGEQFVPAWRPFGDDTFDEDMKRQLREMGVSNTTLQALEPGSAVERAETQFDWDEERGFSPEDLMAKRMDTKRCQIERVVLDEESWQFVAESDAYMFECGVTKPELNKVSEYLALRSEGPVNIYRDLVDSAAASKTRAAEITAQAVSKKRSGTVETRQAADDLRTQGGTLLTTDRNLVAASGDAEKASIARLGDTAGTGAGADSEVEDSGLDEDGPSNREGRRRAERERERGRAKAKALRGFGGTE
ncbi:unnamed protein product [Vitrella brassicaformis CCMP3155]|uniref:Uncharacterized protein n=5 Tax=Vitrella brassicaformis TaxID=1169539 RepID=A0A0G4GLE1_VITBC|nr:unnamed protein product [Vitrella brassicaformis CCMP3155]|eukprot:CEM30941.1 unnamed protein product [Vitrella brassicaformis CCMP3155]